MHIICNTGICALPDMSTLALGCCVPLGIQQAMHPSMRYPFIFAHNNYCHVTYTYMPLIIYYCIFIVIRMYVYYVCICICVLAIIL